MAGEDRKIISLAALAEFKTKYDAYMATYVAQQIQEAAFSSGYTYKGTKTVAELNTIASATPHPSAGDVYNVSDAGTLTAGSVVVAAGDNVAWNSSNSSWNKLSGVIDTSSFATKTDLNSYLPLSAGSTKPLTGPLYVQSDIGAIGGSIVADGTLSLYGSTSMKLHTSDGNNAEIRFQSKNFVFQGPYALSIATTFAPRTDSGGTANTINIPTGNGTMALMEDCMPLHGTTLSTGGFSLQTATGQDAIIKATGTGMVQIESGDPFSIKSNGGQFASLSTELLSSAQVFKFPDESGNLVVGGYASYSSNASTDTTSDIALLFA